MGMVLRENVKALHGTLKKHARITQQLVALTKKYTGMRDQFVQFAANDGDENSTPEDLSPAQDAEFFKAIDRLKAEKIASDAALAAIFTATEPVEA